MRRRQAPAGALPTELMVLVEIDLTGFVSAVSVRAAKTRRRSVVSPLSIEASTSIEFARGMRCISHCTLKTEQRGGQGRLEPAVLANL